MGDVGRTRYERPDRSATGAVTAIAKREDVGSRTPAPPVDTEAGDAPEDDSVGGDEGALPATSPAGGYRTAMDRNVRPDAA